MKVFFNTGIWVHITRSKSVTGTVKGAGQRTRARKNVAGAPAAVVAAAAAAAAAAAVPMDGTIGSIGVTDTGPQESHGQ